MKLKHLHSDALSIEQVEAIPLRGPATIFSFCVLRTSLSTLFMYYVHMHSTHLLCGDGEGIRPPPCPNQLVFGLIAFAFESLYRLDILFWTYCATRKYWEERRRSTENVTGVCFPRNANSTGRFLIVRKSVFWDPMHTTNVFVFLAFRTL